MCKLTVFFEDPFWVAFFLSLSPKKKNKQKQEIKLLYKGSFSFWEEKQVVATEYNRILLR